MAVFFEEPGLNCDSMRYVFWHRASLCVRFLFSRFNEVLTWLCLSTVKLRLHKTSRASIATACGMSFGTEHVYGLVSVFRFLGFNEVSWQVFLWSTQFIGNFHATDVQHTCNTRATYVQHNVQHDHFSCKFTVKMAFCPLSASQGYFKRKRSKFYTVGRKSWEFAAKMLVLHVVLHVCCTCVARVLHVGCMCFLRYCFRVTKVLCWQQALGASCRSCVAGARF